jgi:hypothetical protein
MPLGIVVGDDALLELIANVAIALPKLDVHRVGL